MPDQQLFDHFVGAKLSPVLFLPGLTYAHEPFGTLRNHPTSDTPTFHGFLVQQIIAGRLIPGLNTVDNLA